MLGKPGELLEQVIGILFAVSFDEALARHVGVGAEGEIRLADVGLRMLQPAGALKIRAGLRLQLVKVTLTAAQEHSDAVMRSRNDHRQAPRLEADDTAIAQSIADGDGIAVRLRVDCALQRIVEGAGRAFVQSHFQMSKRDGGLGVRGEHFQFRPQAGTGDDGQPQPVRHSPQSRR